jgi:membrane-associated protein
LLDFLLHFDAHLLDFVRDYGTWVYAILFAIVFAETGFVVTPFLPGDSLLFAAGALCATGELSTPAMLGLLVFAAFAGNTVNYSVGRFIGPRVFQSSHRLLNRKYLERAHAFFEQYGGKAIVLGRFVPIVRTFAPFVAGIGKMRYARFALFNVIGVVVWVASFTLA